MGEKQVITPTAEFRSRLNTLPLEFKINVGELSYQKGMLASSRKNKCVSLFKEFNIPFVEIGTGTNRFIVKYDDYALKIALDKEGVADNRQEWVMSEELGDGVAPSHEISKGGHLLVASYAPAFTSYNEMYSYAQTIKGWLFEWSKMYLLGDVGLSKINYANWGLLNGKPVCIDYAYIFPASLDLFKCICGCRTLTFTDTTYTVYKCTQCSKQYEDRDIRAKISKAERLRLFQNVAGIELKKETEEHPIDFKYVKLSTDPDAPDVYEAAINVARQRYETEGVLV